MSDHRYRFLQLALTADALRFGQFTLKSGRLSPYFFNAGRFDSGARMAQLAACYADAVEATGLKFDVVFGPAYKGIPRHGRLVGTARLRQPDDASHSIQGLKLFHFPCRVTLSV